MRTARRAVFGAVIPRRYCFCRRNVAPDIAQMPPPLSSRTVTRRRQDVGSTKHDASVRATGPGSAWVVWRSGRYDGGSRGAVRLLGTARRWLSAPGRQTALRVTAAASWTAWWSVWAFLVLCKDRRAESRPPRVVSTGGIGVSAGRAHSTARQRRSRAGSRSPLLTFS